MKQFEEYFSEKTIITYLCKLRAKQASNRNKKNILCRLSSHADYNYHKTESENYSDYEREFFGKLNELLPKRRQWVEPNKKGRLSKKHKTKLSTLEKNSSAISQTIAFYKKKYPKEQFLKNLKLFISDIHNSIRQSNYQIDTPEIYPKYKIQLDKSKRSKCRPIGLFKLKDRIILSLTNRYFTDLFDSSFEKCSLAFRARNLEEDFLPSHHDCIKQILKFKSENNETPLWSVECDIEKFYDSVNHKIIREHFYKLIEKVKSNLPETEFTIPTRIFESFLNSYAFNINTKPFNTNDAYWDKHLEKKRGDNFERKFGWVEEGIQKHNLYPNISSERIGIPQGGALSGLIANIVLDVADKVVLNTKVFYTRFCDDMIILHPDKSECDRAKKLYIETLIQLKLVPHEFCEVEVLKIARKKQKENLPPTTIQPFWDNKSKGPYKWSSIESDGFPWIGFVGYELHHEGHIRVRKKSLQKEIKKQKDIIFRIKKAKNQERRKSLGTFGESAIHTLVGMSVGRVQLKNFKTITNELCWKSGFRELTENKHALKQIKELDRNRNKLYYQLADELDEMRKTETNKEVSDSTPKRQLIDFNKPFSYYYQVLERKTKEETK